MEWLCVRSVMGSSYIYTLNLQFWIKSLTPQYYSDSQSFYVKFILHLIFKGPRHDIWSPQPLVICFSLLYPSHPSTHKIESLPLSCCLLFFLLKYKSLPLTSKTLRNVWGSISSVQGPISHLSAIESLQLKDYLMLK